jgi:RNA polymerase sigma factor (sigma-70 family)
MGRHRRVELHGRRTRNRVRWKNPLLSRVLPVYGRVVPGDTVTTLAPAAPGAAGLRLKRLRRDANLTRLTHKKNNVDEPGDFESIVSRAQAGDERALDALLKPVPDLLWRILARFRTLSRAEREDLVQDVFVTLLDRGVAGFSGTTEHEWRAYLRRIAVNTAISRLRHEQLDPGFETWLVRSEDDAADDDPAGAAERDQLLVGLANCMQALDALDHQIFWMRMREHSYEEIVAAVGIPQGTVASKFHRAQQKVVDCVRAAGFASVLKEATA